jgi:hypothetical protein
VSGARSHPLPHRPALLAFVAHIWARSKGEVSPSIAFRKLRKAGAVKIKDRQIYVTDKRKWSAKLRLAGKPVKDGIRRISGWCWYHSDTTGNAIQCNMQQPGAEKAA